MSECVTDEMVFSDLTPIEVPVKNIFGKDYVLCEANAEAAARYRNQAMSGTVFDSNGKPTAVKGLGDLEPLLVHLCLYENSGGQLVRVPLDFVKALPSRIVKPLFERAKQISELNEEAEDSIEVLEKKLAAARVKELLLKNEQKPMEGQSV